LKAYASDLALSLLKLLQSCLNGVFIERIAIDRHIQGPVSFTQTLLRGFHRRFSVAIHHPDTAYLVLPQSKILKQIRAGRLSLELRGVLWRRRPVLGVQSSAKRRYGCDQ
jgi:hypothetical protein